MKERIIILFCIFFLLCLCCCRNVSDTRLTSQSKVQSIEASSRGITNLVYKSSMELQYAKNFAVDYYDGGYVLLTTKTDGKRFLIIPKGMSTPQEIDQDIALIKAEVANIYLVASAVMDMFNELGALQAIRLSGQKEDSWYVEEAKESMKKGDIIYAGKYNKPDYELIVSENCSLAIENMMITHSPEVIEKLEGFGIPVLVEYSSYESHPLGRVEWVKFFGALLGKEEMAETIFIKQLEIVKNISLKNKTNKTVAFFYITSNGLVQVRQSYDYIPKMIEIAGGKYIFDNIGDADSKKSTMNMQIEEFYNGAKDADYIIYNSSIDGGINSVQELLDKCQVLLDFKAVKDGNVWCTTNDMYQQSMSIGYLIEDMHEMLQGGSEKEMKYLFHLE